MDVQQSKKKKSDALENGKNERSKLKSKPSVSNGISLSIDSDDNMPIKKAKNGKRSMKSKRNVEDSNVSLHKVKDKSIRKGNNIVEKKSSLDAFQVMMDARKKVIGTNSPGKDPIICPDDTLDKTIEDDSKVKRKLFLIEWAKSKGGKEKNEKEALYDEEIKYKLGKRKKNFTKMLLNKDTTPNAKRHTSINNSVDKISNSQIMNGSNHKSYSKKIKREQNVEEKSCRTSKKNKLDNLDEIHTKHRKTNSALQSDDDEDFIKNLSPSIKKKENMLSYFKKVDKSSDSMELDDFVSEIDEVSENKSDKSNVIKVKMPMRLKKKRKNLANSSETILPTSRETSIVEINDKSEACVKSAEDMVVNVDSDTSKKNDNSDIETVNIKRQQRKQKELPKYTEYISSESDSSLKEYNVSLSSNKKKSRNILRENMVNNKENNLKNKNDIIECIVSPIKIINIRSPIAIKCIKSPTTRSGIRKTMFTGESKSKFCDKNTKLAPLFMKCLPKPLIDPAVIAARQKFLYSEPAKLIDRCIEVPEPVQECIYFPQTLHIQQIPNVNDLDYYIWNLKLVSVFEKYELHENDKALISDNLKYTNYFKNSRTDCTKVVKNSNYFDLLHSFGFNDFKEGLQKIKSVYANFPVYKTFRQLKDKFTNFNKNLECTQIDNEVLIVNQFDGSSSPVTHQENEDILWTEKYKPLCSDDIVGNFKSVEALKKWLVTWKECSKDMSIQLSRKRSNSSSSDDFLNSDSENDDYTRLPNNTVIVFGPQGSGKTSTIYAIANELDVNILEINASSKRTGKKVMTELQEATQSHKVLTKMNSETSINGLLTSNCTKKNKPHSTGSYLKRKKKTFKKTHSFNASTTKANEKNKMSLILIEDANIVFEEDDGFISALTQIVQTSKRPIIFVSSDLKCNHLRKFITESNVIHFHPLAGKIAGPWLDILLFIESGKFIPNLSKNLIDFYNGDMRLTILQLQFWTSSNKNHKWQDNHINENTNDNIVEEKTVINLIEDSNHSWNGPEKNNDDKITADGCENHNQSVKSNNCTDLNNAALEILEDLTKFSNMDNIWWSISKYLANLAPDMNCFDKSAQRTQTGHIDSNRLEDLNSVSEMLDTFSIIDITETCTKSSGINSMLPWSNKLCNSLSMSENFNEYPRHTVLTSGFCQYMLSLSSAIHKLHRRNSQDIFELHHSDIRWRNKQHLIHASLAEAVPLPGQLDRAGFTLDYMPTLRNICRLEKSRSDSKMKRNNRFYHYLKALSIDVRDSMFDDACQIFNIDVL